MSTCELIILAGIGIVSILAISVVLMRLAEDSHEVYDPGDGSVKIRCPETNHVSVLFGWGESLRCPSCGVKIDPPTKRMTWQKR